MSIALKQFILSSDYEKLPSVLDALIAAEYKIPIKVEELGSQTVEYGSDISNIISDLPSTCTTYFENAASDSSMPIFWNEKNVNVDTKDGGKKHIIRGNFGLGIFNKYDIYPEVEIWVKPEPPETVDLTDWYSNGAILKGKSLKDFTTKEEFQPYFDRIRVSQRTVRTFKGAENVESLPDIEYVDGVSKGYFGEGTFEDCKKLKVLPKTPSSGRISLFGDRICKNCESLTDLSEFSAPGNEEAFMGCINLVNPPHMSAGVTGGGSIARMYKNCRKLPKVFPYKIGIPEAITSADGVRDMFSGTPVEEITIYAGNMLNSTQKTFLCPAAFGENIKKITFVNFSSKVLFERTEADNIEL